MLEYTSTASLNFFLNIEYLIVFTPGSKGFTTQSYILRDAVSPLDNGVIALLAGILYLSEAVNTFTLPILDTADTVVKPLIL